MQRPCSPRAPSRCDGGQHDPLRPPSPAPKPSRSPAAAPSETFLFLRHSPPQYDASIPVVAFGRSCVSLLIPGIQPHQAVTSTGSDCGDGFSQIRSGRAQPRLAPHGAGADHGLAQGSGHRRGHAQPGRPAVDRSFGRRPQRHRGSNCRRKPAIASYVSSPTTSAPR
jgi:hypothetical protein